MQRISVPQVYTILRVLRLELPRGSKALSIAIERGPLDFTLNAGDRREIARPGLDRQLAGVPKRGQALALRKC